MSRKCYKVDATASLVLAVLGIVSVGCGRRVELVPLQGQVMLDGRPLTGGSIMLQPPAGPAARGRIDGAGKFRLGTYRPGDGVIPGRAAVRVAWFDKSSGGNGGGDEEITPGTSRIPERYTDFCTSGITVDVVAGMSPVMIELSTP